MKVVTFYNHKGGVSKTTSTFNLAHLLAQQGRRVLLIDADPQCNMTEICLARLIQKLDEEAAASGGPVPELPGTSLLDLLKPRIEGTVPEIEAGKAVVVKVAERLDLIRGSVDLNATEDSIAEAHNQRFSNKTHEKRTYVAFGEFLQRFGTARAYDYIFIDVGPSSGPLTRMCFLSCDAFFIPVAPDRFNVQAIQTLTTIIDRWLREHQQIVDSFRELGLPVRPGRPVFLGVVAQFFKTHGGKPKPAYKMWMDRIPETAEQYLIPMLHRHWMDGSDLTHGVVKANIIVTQIPDFGSLAPVMQEWGKAVFNIEQVDTAAMDGKAWQGATWTDAVARMDSYKQKIEAVAVRLRSLT